MVGVRWVGGCGGKDVCVLMGWWVWCGIDFFVVVWVCLCSSGCVCVSRWLCYCVCVCVALCVCVCDWVCVCVSVGVCVCHAVCVSCCVCVWLSVWVCPTAYAVDGLCLRVFACESFTVFACVFISAPV